MVQCCILLNIFGASYLLYIFGALYLVLGLFLTRSGQDLVWNIGFPVAFTYLERFEP